MTLTSLADMVQKALQFEKHPERIRVVIPVELPYKTAGATPIVEADYVSVGFDWNAGTFRISPKEKVMPIKHDVPQAVVEWEGMLHCPKCERILGKQSMRIDTDVRFCKYCGQAIKWQTQGVD